jgi:hypothetical protein
MIPKKWEPVHKIVRKQDIWRYVLIKVNGIEL